MQKPNRTSLKPDDIVSIRIAVRLGVRIRYISRMTGIPRMTVFKIAAERNHVQVFSETLSLFEDA